MISTEMRLAMLQNVFENSPLAICITAVDEACTILDANPAYLSMTGRDGDKVRGTPLFEGNEAEAKAPDRLRMLGLLATQGYFDREEVELTHTSGRRIPTLISAQRVIIGEMAADIEIIMDNSERKAFEKAIIHAANTDSLTQLPNRRAFDTHLTKIIKAARADTLIGLVFIDLNRFKAVNDQLGHVIGDRVLQTVAHRLRSRVKETDFVARLGGDEFGLILEVQAENPIHAQRLDALVRELGKDILIDGQSVSIGAAVGAVLSRLPADGATLLHHADQLMYRAKATGALFAVELKTLEEATV